MNRLQEWKRRINATQLSDDDKQKACDGLDRIWATGEGVEKGYDLEDDYFPVLFYWSSTTEGQDFWYDVFGGLEDAGLPVIDKPPTNRRRKTIQETPRSGGEG